MSNSTSDSSSCCETPTSDRSASNDVRPRCNCTQSDVELRFDGVKLDHQCIGFLYNRQTGGHDPVTKFTWRNSNFMTASVMTYGATIMRITVPNKYAACEDIVLGFDTLDEYVQHADYHFGCVLGRCANVIAGAEYEMHKHCDVITLTGNELADADNLASPYNHRDGGAFGLSRVNWSAYSTGNQVIMSYVSPANDEGYPGALMVQIRFEMTVDNQLIVSYMAQAEKTTPVNLSHRLPLNLAGHGSGLGTLAEHVFSVNARKHVQYDREHQIPTGKTMKIGETVHDCRVAGSLGERLRNAPLGYFRETFVVHTILPSKIGTAPKPKMAPEPLKSPHCTTPKRHFVSRVIHPSSGRVIEIYTSQRCVEFSTCHHLPYIPPPTPSVHSMEPVGSGTGAMCTAIIDDIVTEFTDNSRFVRRDLQTLINRVCDIRMAADGTIPKDVARELLQQVCNELRILREEEELMEEGVEEEDEEGNGEPQPICGKDQARYMQNCGFYAQTQNYPDAVHHRGRYGDVMLRPTETYRHDVVYKFGLHMGGVLPARLYLSNVNSYEDSELGSEKKPRVQS